MCPFKHNYLWLFDLIIKVFQNCPMILKPSMIPDTVRYNVESAATR